MIKEAGGRMWDELKACLPADSAAQSTAAQYIVRFGSTLSPGDTVLDLGCGAGESFDLFRRVAPETAWIGIQLEGSPSAGSPMHDDLDIRSLDVTNIPVTSGSVALVYSRQAFERVLHPHALLSEVVRTLKAGGSFIGTISSLEPVHSSSLWNITPLGFKRLIEAVGMVLVELRPGIDSMTLIERAFKGNDKNFNRWFNEESTLNQEIDAWAKAEGHSLQVAAFRKLTFCGQFCFWVRKPE